MNDVQGHQQSKGQQAPFISVIVTARNDNYGGNFNERFQIFLDVLSQLCEQAGLRVELIIVEWNPPNDRPLLQEQMDWPKNLEFFESRLIRVPAEIHNRFERSDRFPLLEFQAKNAGMRRARGKFVLCTNADVLFSRPLVAFLAKEKLKSGCFYRTSRWDTTDVPPKNISVDEKLQFCADHVFQRYIYDNIEPVPAPPWWKLPVADIRGAFKLWSKRLRHVKDRLYTAAAGDFFLVDRQKWLGLRGYPEFPLRVGIDSYMCVIAATSGLKQYVLGPPMGLYHPDHIRHEGHVHSDPGKYADITGFDLRAYRNHRRQMFRERKPIIFNDESWGLANQQLEETTIS